MSCRTSYPRRIRLAMRTRLVRVRVDLDEISHEVAAHEQGPRTDVLVQAMHAVEVRVCPHSGHAIDRDADRLEVGTVARACGHDRYERYAGEIPGDQFLRRADDPRIQRG